MDYNMKITKQQLRSIIKEAMDAPNKHDQLKQEMIDDMSDFLMRGPDVIKSAIPGYDSMSSEELSNYADDIYDAASESMTFSQRYGEARDDIMREKVSDQLGLK